MKMKRFVALVLCLCVILLGVCSCGKNADYSKIEFIKWTNNSKGMLSNKRITVEKESEFKDAFDEIADSKVVFGGLEVNSDVIVIVVATAEGIDASEYAASLNADSYEGVSIEDKSDTDITIYASERKTAMKAIKAWSVMDGVKKITVKHNLEGTIG